MSDNITKITIANKILYETGLPVSIALSFVDNLFQEIMHLVSNEQRLKISNFGSFHINKKKPRIGRNLNTQKEVMIKSRKVVLFSPSNQLKQKVNTLETL